MTFREQARDYFDDRLRFGEKVDGLTLADLIESDLAGDRCREAEVEVAGLLTMDEPDRSLFILRYHDKLIKDWLDRKEDLIEEKAAEMAQDYSESVVAA